MRKEFNANTRPNQSKSRENIKGSSGGISNSDRKNQSTQRVDRESQTSQNDIRDTSVDGTLQTTQIQVEAGKFNARTTRPNQSKSRENVNVGKKYLSGNSRVQPNGQQSGRQAQSDDNNQRDARLDVAIKTIQSSTNRVNSADQLELPEIPKTVEHHKTSQIQESTKHGLGMGLGEPQTQRTQVHQVAITKWVVKCR